MAKNKGKKEETETKDKITTSKKENQPKGKANLSKYTSAPTITDPELESKKKRRKQIVRINKILLLVVAVLGNATLYYCLTTPLPSNFASHFGIRIPSKFDLQAKILLLAKCLSLFGVMFVINTFTVIGARMVTASMDPVTRKNTMPVELFNRIFVNNLEQFFIFTTALVAWTFIKGNDSNKLEIVRFCAVHFLGRVLFAIGYIIGTITPYVTMRSFGMIVTLGNTICILLKVFGYLQ